MRLRKIKLAGFKSFVDPTSLLVSDNLVGIVGPNGCGKSNIIDAVTWVMGESSAKHLRGDALVDVIFNGSSARQPVGQASVELLFDNSEGKVGGPYAGYSEISIKRLLNRDTISTYYLNGIRCRRKDIQGIFLGTGLGPRGYSIIEQGVISRLIEARPEELRTFLEEAAGISKFRERRRETENRIRHARDNISRLTDIREELERQLEHLQRQAKAAERFKELKQEERRLKAELLALNWRALLADAKEKAELVHTHENKVDEALAGLRRIEVEIETQRENYTAANEAFNQAQAVFYRIGSDVSHTEQRINHARERIETSKTDIDKARETELALQRQLEDDRKDLIAITEKARVREPRLQEARSRGSEAYDLLNQAEETMQARQYEWDSLNRAMAEFDQQVKVDETRIELLLTGLQELEQRRNILYEETGGLDFHELKEQMAQLSTANSESEGLLEQRKGEQNRTSAELQRYRAEVERINSQLLEVRAHYQKNESKIASLEALQHEDSMDYRETLQQWLSVLGLGKAPRLIEGLEVREGWETAFEMVAGGRLQDISVDNLREAGEAAATLEAGKVGLLLNNADPVKYAPKPYPRLIDKVSAAHSLEAVLGGIYLAEDLDQAMNICTELDENESVVTRDGVWLNNYWMRIHRSGDAASGVLSREQELSQLKSRRLKLEKEIKSLEEAAAEKNGMVDAAEQKSGLLLEQVNEQQEHAAASRARYTEYKTRFEQWDNRARQVDEELRSMALQEDDDRKEIKDLENRLEQGRESGKKLDEERNRLEGLRSEHKQVLDNARTQWQSSHEDSHEIALQLESFRSQKTSMEQAIKRSEIHISGIGERIRELESDLLAQDGPLQDLSQTLDVRLSEKMNAETGLTMAREAVQKQEKQLRDKEQERNEHEQQIQLIRSGLEQVRIHHQETRVRLQTVEEQLEAMDHTPQDLLEGLDEDADKNLWQEKIDSVERRVQRLGAINLAAIDEYEQLAERKTYLDSQHEDLSTALETLEGAIHKIDKETRTRFKETFDKLNANLKENFPILFGGGHAYLEMTGNDLLETGVTVMARPPGKKNSNIHLLSGGEKALTAVALVFSIFKLNPAPFCILDEVDAPLDDNNVARFSEMVNKMSEDVQFIIITHNKITMEITRQLLGVTMHEPGVSRLVSVDIDEAVEMAASA